MSQYTHFFDNSNSLVDCAFVILVAIVVSSFKHQKDPTSKILSPSQRLDRIKEVKKVLLEVIPKNGYQFIGFSLKTNEDFIITAGDMNNIKMVEALCQVGSKINIEKDKEPQYCILSIDPLSEQWDIGDYEIHNITLNEKEEFVKKHGLILE